jgi:hypothetical protein
MARQIRVSGRQNAGYDCNGSVRGHHIASRPMDEAQ